MDQWLVIVLRMNDSTQRRAPSDRTTVRRIPKRAHYDRKTIHDILDEAFACHVGFVAEGQPFVIPAVYARIGETLYLHGAVASRMLKCAGGAALCVTVTLIDGLVLARSAFHHSMNYRSVVVLGHGQLVTDRDETLAALRALIEHMAPGRSKVVRAPNDKELAATAVVALSLEEASAKVRVGPPIDDEEDFALECWAGVIPIALTASDAVVDQRVSASATPPRDLLAMRRSKVPL